MYIASKVRWTVTSNYMCLQCDTYCVHDTTRVHTQLHGGAFGREHWNRSRTYWLHLCLEYPCFCLLSWMKSLRTDCVSWAFWTVHSLRSLSTYITQKFTQGRGLVLSHTAESDPLAQGRVRFILGYCGLHQCLSPTPTTSHNEVVARTICDFWSHQRSERHLQSGDHWRCKKSAVYLQILSTVISTIVESFLFKDLVVAKKNSG